MKSKAAEVAEALTDFQVGDLVWWGPEPYIACVVVYVAPDGALRIRTNEGAEYYVSKCYLKMRE